MQFVAGRSPPLALAYLQLLDRYEEFLRVEKNLAEKTRKAYLYDLNRFGQFLAGRLGRLPPVARIDTPLIREYLNHQQLELRHRSTTLARTIASLRKFFEFCVMRGEIESSPAAVIHNPKQPRKLPIYLLQEELVKLLKAPDRTEAMGLRDAAILTTLAFTGCRLSEIVGLSLRDLSREPQAIRVMGKGSKERIIPLNALAMIAIDEWLAARPPSENAALFLNRYGRRLTGRSVENIVRKYVLLAGVFKDRISPHKLRHTFATLLHSRDVDILEIQALLGHSSITSTQIYTHTSSSRLRAAVGKLDSVGK